MLNTMGDLCRGISSGGCMGQFSEGKCLRVFRGIFVVFFQGGNVQNNCVGGCLDPRTEFPLSAYAAVMILATLVNTQTDRQQSTGYIL